MSHTASFRRIATGSNFPVPTQQQPGFTYTPLPWEQTSCTWCESNSDCRSPMEYCDFDGCCHAGQCLKDSDCVEASNKLKYFELKGFDSFGNDSNAQHPQDNRTLLETACDVNPDCIAYTAYGFLKHKIEPPEFWDQQPPIPGLPQWVMYLKKSALEQKNANVGLVHGMKIYCGSPEFAAYGGVGGNITGVCRDCLACEKDEDCPISTSCNEKGCCVNNPCYTATPEDGEWIDGHYSRSNQCVCSNGEKYCCLADPGNVFSAYCSKKPCKEDNNIMACAYVCEDPERKFDAVMCKANERCCNTGPGAPICCAPGSDCNTGDSHENTCTAGTMKKCEGSGNFQDILCFHSQTCCNNAQGPPVCCNDPHACRSGETNICYLDVEAGAL